MDNQEYLTACQNMIVSVLRTTENLCGREVADRLWTTAGQAFRGETPQHSQQSNSVADKVDSDLMNAHYTSPLAIFTANGGYDLTDAQVMMQYCGQIHHVMAFGILPPKGSEPRLNFLLANGEEVDHSLSELSRFSFTETPLYQSQSTVIFLPNKESRWDLTALESIISGLYAVHADKLAEAFTKLNPFTLRGVTDDVPKAELVPLTDEERDTLEPIEGVQFTYANSDDVLLRITPVDGGFVFHSRQQSVEVNARNVEVSWVMEPKPRKGYWLLRVSPGALLVGVTLHDVLKLSEDDSRRDTYQPLIDIFNRQSLEATRRKN